MNRSVEQGFTLLEVLVALAICGLLFLGLIQGTQFGMRAWQRQAADVQRYEALDTVDRVLRQSLSQIHSVQSATGDRLSFSGELPRRASRTSEVADIQLGLDGDRFVYSWRQHTALRKAGGDSILAEGVARLDVAYWQSPEAGAPGQWLREWTANTPPALIRFGFVFIDPGRRWPAIAVKPVFARRLADQFNLNILCAAPCAR